MVARSATLEQINQLTAERDQLIDQEYRRIYGTKYEEVVRPPAIAEAEDAVPTLVAA